MMNELGQEGWTPERTSWEQLQSLVDLLNQAVEVTPDWVELCVLHQDTRARMLHRACPACLQQMFVDDPYHPDPVIDDPHTVGEPTVMLRPPRKSGILYLPDRSGVICRPGCVLVCEMCADTRTVEPGDVAFNDDHPLVGCSWRAAWSVCDVVMADDGGRPVPFYRQTLAEVIAKVRAASDWNEEVVDIGNFLARVSVSVASKVEESPALSDVDSRAVDRLEQLAPAFFHLQAEGVDAKALREPARAWLQAADEVGHSLWASEILNQVAEAVRTEDLHLLKDHMAVALHSHLWDTGEAVKWLRAMIADTLTLTPEGYHSRFGYV